MYDGIKKALGPTLNKTAPLRSSTGEVITDKGHQLERWVELYSDLYSRENIVSPSALDAVECRPCKNQTQSRLWRSSARPSTPWSLARPLAAMAPLHPPSPPPTPELIKHCKTTLLHSLYVLLCQCWQGAVPQDMRDAKIITLFKNKGATATTTEASPFSALFAKRLQKSF